MTPFESTIARDSGPDGADRRIRWHNRMAALVRLGLAWDDARAMFSRGRFEVPAEFVYFEPADAWNGMLRQFHAGATAFDRAAAVLDGAR